MPAAPLLPPPPPLLIVPLLAAPPPEPTPAAGSLSLASLPPRPSCSPPARKDLSVFRSLCERRPLAPPPIWWLCAALPLFLHPHRPRPPQQKIQRGTGGQGAAWIRSGLTPRWLVARIGRWAVRRRLAPGGRENARFANLSRRGAGWWLNLFSHAPCFRKLARGALLSLPDFRKWACSQKNDHGN